MIYRIIPLMMLLSLKWVFFLDVSTSIDCSPKRDYDRNCSLQFEPLFRFV